MDQMACSIWKPLVHINFADVETSKIEQVRQRPGCSWITAYVSPIQRVPHADLTLDYAAIPQEMKQVAEFFGKEVLGEGVSKQEIHERHTQIREKPVTERFFGPFHFMNEE